MANLTPVPGNDNVPQLETTTLALGGPGAPMNTQAQALLNRTAQLALDIAAAQGDSETYADNLMAAHEAASNPHPQYTTDAEVNALIAAYLAANPPPTESNMYYYSQI